MSDSRRTAVIVGILYIVGTCAGVLSVACTSSILGSADLLASVSAEQLPMQLGVLCVLIMGFSLAMVPILMFPILRKQGEALAIGYVVFRGALETATYIAFAMCWLGLISVAKGLADADPLRASHLRSLGALLRSASDSSQVATVFTFGLGALIFSWLLYQSRLIPRWLPIWGLAAIALHSAGGFLQLFGVASASSPLLTVMSFPIFLQEMVLAVWLISRGFNATADQCR